jgi:dihydroorotate dehydrogenase (fumarate)
MLKATMAGASASMIASTLLKYGVSHIEDILNGAVDWMIEHEYESINQMKGSMSQQAVAEPAAFERANYIKVLSSFDLRFAP